MSGSLRNAVIAVKVAAKEAAEAIQKETRMVRVDNMVQVLMANRFQQVSRMLKVTSVRHVQLADAGMAVHLR